jgi:hypothetical protein
MNYENNPILSGSAMAVLWGRFVTKGIFGLLKGGTMNNQAIRDDS